MDSYFTRELRSRTPRGCVKSTHTCYRVNYVKSVCVAATGPEVIAAVAAAAVVAAAVTVVAGVAVVAVASAAVAAISSLAVVLRAYGYNLILYEKSPQKIKTDVKKKSPRKLKVHCTLLIKSSAPLHENIQLLVLKRAKTETKLDHKRLTLTVISIKRQAKA